MVPESVHDWIHRNTPDGDECSCCICLMQKFNEMYAAGKPGATQSQSFSNSFFCPGTGMSSVTTRIFLSKLEEPRAVGFDYDLPSILDFQSSPDSALAPIDDIN